MTEGCYFIKIDIKDVYFHIAIHQDYLKYLCFEWKGQIIKFVAMPFGLNIAPRIFTKILKPVIFFLQEKGITTLAYLDDIIIIAKTSCKAAKHSELVSKLLLDLGFIINKKKSVLTPHQKANFLGFTIDSRTLEINITKEKKKKTVEKVDKFISNKKCTIRDLAKLIGILNALAPAVKGCFLMVRELIFVKNHALNIANEFWDAQLCCTKDLSVKAIRDLYWWKDTLQEFKGKLCKLGKTRKTFYTDTSNQGWGGFLTKSKILQEAVYGRFTTQKLNNKQMEQQTRSNSHSKNFGTLLQSNPKSKCGILGRQHNSLQLLEKRSWKEQKSVLNFEKLTSPTAQSKHNLDTKMDPKRTTFTCRHAFMSRRQDRLENFARSLENNRRNMGTTQSGPFCKL